MLETGGGFWKFAEHTPNQVFTKAQRYATGVRQPVALAWHDGHLFAAMNSRDSLDTLWPGKFTVADNANRPLELCCKWIPGPSSGGLIAISTARRTIWCWRPSTAATEK